MGDEVIGMCYSNNKIIMYKKRVSLYSIAISLSVIRLSNLEMLDLGSTSFNNSILSFVEGLPSLKSLYLNYNRRLIDLKCYFFFHLDQILINYSFFCKGWSIHVLTNPLFDKFSIVFIHISK